MTRKKYEQADVIPERFNRGQVKSNFGGILSGLTDLVEKLGDLAEKGEQLSKSGEFSMKDKQGNDLKGVFGFSVKMGLGGDEVKVEPFGNIRKDKSTGESVVQEIREPMVDILEEEKYILVIAEMPGIGMEDMQVEINDDILTISAQKKDKKYRKEILLPGSFTQDKMTVSCKNGVTEIKLNKG